MIKIAICDDDAVFLNKLKSILAETLEQFETNADIETYTSGKSLLSEHNKKEFDVVFLDIDMPDKTGFEIANAINENDKKSYIIFITSHSELVYDSFMFRPLNFITKSDNISDRLSYVIKQLFEQMKQNRLITLEDKDKNKFFIPMKEIIYIESSAHYADYYIANRSEPIHIRANISDLENEYKTYDFMRIHRKIIVNLKYVFNMNLKKGTVSLKDGLELPVSRVNRDEIDDMLTDYLRRTK